MDDVAFAETVASHQRRVFTLAGYLLGSLEEAEDVTQDVFLRFWRHRESVPADCEKAWLLRVTRNACIDRMRSRRSRFRLGACGVDGHHLHDDLGVDVLGQMAPAVHSGVVDQEIQAAIRQSVIYCLGHARLGDVADQIVDRQRVLREAPHECDHVPAAGGQLLRQAPAEAAARSGDEGGLGCRVQGYTARRY